MKKNKTLINISILIAECNGKSADYEINLSYPLDLDNFDSDVRYII
ncbi:MAG: hypothetical protein J07HQW2_00226 [Haloquadratum walsbyi J07HQW2]|uniref:Uncharacterized protein n=1 Tax=Haloquadratum walsbyi J07HQW2 TaxID=1238425 RepID=U1PJF3_9EURY|nr:MAG: hypothetical protein J07HQW2_00226 [Haloquadratum walsbyi J07HQW2]